MAKAVDIEIDFSFLYKEPESITEAIVQATVKEVMFKLTVVKEEFYPIRFYIAHNIDDYIFFRNPLKK